MKLQSFFEKAYQSARGLKKLNFILSHGIPFNRPHKIRIEEIKPGFAKVSVPYIRKNLNHLKGIHACCLATCAEYTTGLVMMSVLESDKYRLIMEGIKIDYHYQAKMGCVVEYTVDDEEIQDKIIAPLATTPAVFFSSEVVVFDVEGNRICTAVINWQIKRWDRVRTAV